MREPQNILNDAQLGAAHASVGHHCIVNSPPGTGKSRVFIERIRHLLSFGCSAQNILALTFSIRTVHDLREKLKESNLPVQARTFHSFANIVLRDNHKEANLNKDFQIIESTEQQNIIHELLERYEGCFRYLVDGKQIQNYINERKQKVFQPAPVVESDAYSREQNTFYNHYESYCQHLGLVDFTELLIKVCTLFDEHPTILASYQDKFPQVLCDEYHDVEPLQVELLQRLTSNGGSILFALADPYQTIYGFRGSDLDYTVNFSNYFPDAQSYQLTDNYRSGQKILDVANAIVARCELSHNSIAKIPKLRSALGEEYNNPVHFFEAPSDIDEVDFIAQQIGHYHQHSEINFSQIAVLYRTNAQSEIIKNRLKNKNIPCRINDRADNLYDRIEIRDILAYLRFIHNHENDHALKRIINKPARRIGKVTRQVLQKIMTERKLSMWESIAFVLERKQDFIQDGTLNGKSIKALGDFVLLINQLSQAGTLTKIIERVLKLAGLFQYYQKRPNNSEEIKAFKKFIEIASVYQSINPKANLNDFLIEITIEPQSEQVKAVQLMTLHACKGLQFDVVFIVGVHEGRLPSYYSLNEGLEAVEEERRLFYVGVTRARKHLSISYSKESDLPGSSRITKNDISTFIEDIPENLLINLTGKVSNLNGKVDNLAGDDTDTQAFNQVDTENGLNNENWLNAEKVSELYYDVNLRNAQKVLANAYHKKIIRWREADLKVRINPKTRAYEVYKDSLPPLSPFEVKPLHKPTISVRDSIINPYTGVILPQASMTSNFFPVSKGELMVDWLMICQEFPYNLPPLNDGFTISYDAWGNVEWTSIKKFVYEGSYSSKVLIWTKGRTLYASGNFGRFGRQENILNYNLVDTIIILNNILDRKEFSHLPKFSIGKFTFIPRKLIKTRRGTRAGGKIREYNGARLLRTDWMKNYSFKTEQEKEEWMYYISKIHLPYMGDPVIKGQMESFYWGLGSKDYLIKVYDKAVEFLEHYKGQITKGSYLEECYEYLRDNHIIRIEIKLTGRLAKIPFKILGQIMKGKPINDWKTDNFYARGVEEFFNDKTKPLLSDADKINWKRLREMNKSAADLFTAWMGGVDVRNQYKERTMKAHKKLIREVIGVWVNLDKPPPKRLFDGTVTIVMPTEAPMPGDFYQMPQVSENK